MVSNGTVSVILECFHHTFSIMHDTCRQMTTQTISNWKKVRLLYNLLGYTCMHKSVVGIFIALYNIQHI